MRMIARAAAGALLVLGLAAPAAPAAMTKLLAERLTATGATYATCHDGARGAGVVTRRLTAPANGLIDVRLKGGTGDWDVALRGINGRFVAASAAPGTSEIAQGFVFAGERLVLSACRRPAAASSASITVATTPVGRGDGTIQMVRVRLDGPDAMRRLEALGLDLTEHARPGFADVVLYGDRDVRRLRDAGFHWTVRIADMIERDVRRELSDRSYRDRTSRSAFPSGRTEYRHLADYEADMKALAQQYPSLVKLIELNHKSLEGRPVLGIEITKNANVVDGKPVVVQLGIHHAREWPSAEHPMEWAFELLHGYGKDDRVTRLVSQTRTIVVPVVNPDGFNLSRESTVDLGNLLAGIDLPPEIDSQLPISDPTFTGAILIDQNAGFYAYKRRNCRIKDGERPNPGDCENSDNRLLGVDPNRNYGGSWGGPGASSDPGDDTYRGAAPFSEPEVQNVRELVSSRQVTELITNHTFSNLVLRPPGIRSAGTTPDEEAYKALSDEMAAQNGYASIYGYSLYDTTGTTEDWSYAVTGGFGFTFEIGPDEFHPPFEEAVAEYDGAGKYAGKGNRAAYFVLQEHATQRKFHSLITGRAPKGAKLEIRKRVKSVTSPVLSPEGIPGKEVEYTDVLTSRLEAARAGRFTWHVNPSTRPAAQRDRVVSEVAEKAAFEQDISSPVPPVPGVPNETEFEVKAGENRQVRITTTGVVPVDDIDIYLYYGSVTPENQVSSSAGGTADELLVYDRPLPGKYILQVVNFAAAGPYDGKIEVFPAKPGTERTVKKRTERWTLTCRVKGKVAGKRSVVVDRGKRVNVGNACKKKRKARRAR